ncbi:mechanosensitive ion channel, partial [Arthrobacter deserti]|nr:mechanosensitive ion channel [Arthrobacter deserti]
LLTKYSTDTKDNRRFRRLKTQVILSRRVAVALVITVAVACVLLTIPQVRALGAGILASAGVLSVGAGLALQGSLTNVFAGMQLAFTDAIRVDDVVVVEKQWGTVEEITMTYVVVHIWDDRRLILPSTYF